MERNENGEGGGTRTHDSRIKSPLLYRLSYAPHRVKYSGGFEPP